MQVSVISFPGLDFFSFLVRLPPHFLWCSDLMMHGACVAACCFDPGRLQLNRCILNQSRSGPDRLLIWCTPTLDSVVSLMKSTTVTALWFKSFHVLRKKPFRFAIISRQPEMFGGIYFSQRTRVEWGENCRVQMYKADTKWQKQTDRLMVVIAVKGDSTQYWLDGVNKSFLIWSILNKKKSSFY